MVRAFEADTRVRRDYRLPACLRDPMTWPTSELSSHLIEQEVEILEGLGEKKARHLIIQLGAPCIFYPRVTASCPAESLYIIGGGGSERELGNSISDSLRTNPLHVPAYI